MIRAVVDINVIVSALIIPRGIPHSVWSAWRSLQFTLISSEGVILELGEKLREPKIAQTYGISEEDTSATLTLLRAQATLIPVPPEQHLTVTGDPEDDLVLATGRLGQADYLVSGDRHLLNLGQHEGTRIITPREFMAILESQARLPS
jgi:putative PIN family toxin of toxin-antitoxin system